MPKQKTVKSAAKRFKFSSRGKIKRKHAGLKHILEHKSSGKKHKMGKMTFVSQTDYDRVKKMLPGG